MKKIRFLFVGFVLFVLCGATALAHQPRTPEGSETIISDPEISKAFYAKMDGEPHVYTLSSDTSFLLYVNILVPDLPDQKRDLSVTILKDGDAENPLAVLEGNGFEWTKFLEPFGNDSYWMGPEYEAMVESGEYTLIVSSANNDVKYSLATGKIEAFDFKETVNALTMIPKTKRDFFEKSPVDFIFSPLAIGLIIVMFVLAFVFGFVYRFLLKRFAQSDVRKKHKNMGWKDRVLRLFLAVVLFIVAITTSWNPVLIFLSGFALFEAIFSWCGFYAAIGRSTCPR